MRAGKCCAAAAGFTYVAVLFALALFAIGLSALGEAWTEASRRDRERELLQVGSAFVRAIASYHQRSPGSRVYPQRLEDLLEDARYVDVQRHLRQLYRDPVNPRGEWGLIRAADGGIMGVHSLSDKECLRRQPAILPHGGQVTGRRYAEWKFIYVPSARPD